MKLRKIGQNLKKKEQYRRNKEQGSDSSKGKDERHKRLTFDKPL